MSETALSVVDTPRAARLLLHPLRRRILAAAQEPASAAAIASALGLPRQRVNYHVGLLARAGFLARAGRRRRRGLTEQRYVVSARAFVIAPEVLGQLADTPPVTPERLTADWLVASAARTQNEVARAGRAADAAGRALPVLGLDTTVAFASAAQRARFAAALTAAITRVIADHTTPPGASGTRRPYRLALGCYPIPEEAQ